MKSIAILTFLTLLLGCSPETSVEAYPLASRAEYELTNPTIVENGDISFTYQDPNDDKNIYYFQIRLKINHESGSYEGALIFNYSDDKLTLNTGEHKELFQIIQLTNTSCIIEVFGTDKKVKIDIKKKNYNQKVD